jgi:hypothetical protein
MNIREQIKKVAILLDEEVMNFDWDTYEYKEDIPHLSVDGTRFDVEQVFITKDGLTMIIVTKDDEIVFGFYEDDETTFETIDKELDEVGMDAFLRDIYYNHPRSYEIGDYEDDFLNL